VAQIGKSWSYAFLSYKGIDGKVRGLESCKEWGMLPSGEKKIPTKPTS